MCVCVITVEENRERRAKKHLPYDPVSGLGCVGERRALRVSDRNEGSPLYLPVEMWQEDAVRLLEASGSVREACRNALCGAGEAEQNELEGYFWLKLCEVRYRYDFEFYAVSCETIRDKETGREIRFRLNRAQRQLLEVLERQRKAGRQINVQILKARQMGFSTLVQMYMKWIQTVHRKNWNSVVCSADLTSAVNIRSMYDESMREMPPIAGVKMTLSPFAGTQNIKVIPERGCRITVGSAQRPETVRSQDVKMVHFSEVAFYPHTERNNPSLLESSIVSSVPNVPFSLIVRESTANGVGDYFYEQWNRAKKGESAYEAFFAPWYLLEIYEEELDGTYYAEGVHGKKRGSAADFIRSLSPYERELWAKSEEVTLESLNWRRGKLNTMSNPEKMAQEFPSDDIEAFVDSGTPVFRSADVEGLRADCTPPAVLGDLAGRVEAGQAASDPMRRSDVLREIRFVPDERATRLFREGDSITRGRSGLNKLQVWKGPDTTKRVSDRYIVCLDPQQGMSEGADYGVIKVWDRFPMISGDGPEVVALFYGHLDKDVTIWKAAQVAKWYNDALLVVESNTYESGWKSGGEGEFVFDVIADYYGNLYSRTESDKVKEGVPLRYGFQTNKNTKPMVVNHYIGILREKAYTERDEETLNEARVYEVKEDGSMGAKAGKHDDRLMATMIGLYVCYKMAWPRAYGDRSAVPGVKKAVW